MKRLKIISVLTIAAILSSVVIINSCSKQEMGTQDNTFDEQVFISDKDIAVTNSIKNFKRKVEYIKEHPQYKSGETLSIDSAVWYLDAGVNFTHAFTFETFENFHTDSVFVEIPINNGEVDMNDLSDAYYELVSKIRDDVYATVQEEDKDLYVSSTEVKEETAGTLTIKTTATIGSKHIEPGTEVPFGDEDDWMYGEIGGTCDDPTIESDAAHEIKNATQTYKYLYLPDHGDGWVAIYTLPEKTVEILSHEEYLGPTLENLLLNPDDDKPEDNERDRLLFFQTIDNVNGGNPIDECILDDDMNFYYFGAHDLIYNVIPGNADFIGDWDGVQGKAFYEVEDVYGYYTGPSSNKTSLYHYIRINYKTRWIAEDHDPVHIGPGTK